MSRILNSKVAIDETAVTDFFEDRARRYDDSKPLVSVIYQDNNPALAEARDAHEKQVILPQLNLQADDRVLDMGCGIGRWAEALRGNVAHYHGTDLVQGLTDIATRRFADCPNFTFQPLRAQDNRPEMLTTPPPFSLIIITGLFIYLNDADCRTVLTNIAACAAPNARLYLREPVGVETRLTLDNIWSEELKHHYSAIYRPVAEYLPMLEDTLGAAGFAVTTHAPLFPPELGNRKETTQHYFMLERK